MPKTGRIPESPEVPDILVSDFLSLTLQTFSLCCPLTRKTFGRRCPEVPDSRTRGREISSVEMPLSLDLARPPGRAPVQRPVTPISHAHSDLLSSSPKGPPGPGHPPIFSWPLLVHCVRCPPCPPSPPCPSVHLCRLLPISFEDTCTTVCQSRGSHLADEQKGGPGPASPPTNLQTLTRHTWTQNTCQPPFIQ